MFPIIDYIPFTNRHDYARFGDAYKFSRLPNRCCGCFPNFLGSFLGSLFMSALSFYFAATAFMQQSPFFTYLPFAPLVVFGVMNVIYGLVTFATVMVLIRPRMTTTLDRPLARALGFALAAVIMDLFANVIYVGANPSQFINACMADGLASVETNLPNTTTLTLTQDYYNCGRLLQDEIKWSLGCSILIFLVYTHWVVFIAAFIGKYEYRLGVTPMFGPGLGIPSLEAAQPVFASNLPPSTYQNLKPNELEPGETLPSEKVLITPLDTNLERFTVLN
ncbi:hypothetical protein DM01DRAFT_1075553 [Hesseltinella vesiculosa]|uniref:Uncharacterized protein n=1 Tax=Hesseltinella vesiculosa TaxID=101127 RepID=A0A1X2GWA3_9FUNG|nr:hypothetical protein DM01DRAFT_1075553 [Hesseltinella vesiculosa]